MNYLDITTNPPHISNKLISIKDDKRLDQEDWTIKYKMNEMKMVQSL
jgi:hypothetical protein